MDMIIYLNGKLIVRVVKVGYIVKFIGSNGVFGSMLNFSIVDLINVMMVILSDES